MTPRAFLAALGAIHAAALLLLCVIQVLAARSRARHRGELAFHRHTLSALEARDARRHAEVLKRCAEIEAALATRRGAA